jgi:hypothetical protein
VDADVQKDDCCSIPRHSLIYDHSLAIEDYLPYIRHNLDWSDYNYIFFLYKSTLFFMSCPNPILISPSYPYVNIVDASSCKNGSTLFNSTSNISSPSYSYVFIGPRYDFIGYRYLRAILDLCHINLIYPASFRSDQLENGTNISYIDVQDSILYGFYLSWSGACCDFLKENRCKLDEANNINKYCSTLLSLSLSLSLSHTHTHTHTKRKIMRYRLS